MCRVSYFFKFQILIISWVLFKMSHLISIHSKIKKIFILSCSLYVYWFFCWQVACIPSFGGKNLHLHVTPWKKLVPRKKIFSTIRYSYNTSKKNHTLPKFAFDNKQLTVQIVTVKCVLNIEWFRDNFTPLNNYQNYEISIIILSEYSIHECL